MFIILMLCITISHLLSYLKCISRSGQQCSSHPNKRVSLKIVSFSVIAIFSQICDFHFIVMVVAYMFSECSMNNASYFMCNQKLTCVDYCRIFMA